MTIRYNNIIFVQNERALHFGTLHKRLQRIVTRFSLDFSNLNKSSKSSSLLSHQSLNIFITKNYKYDTYLAQGQQLLALFFVVIF